MFLRVLLVAVFVTNCYGKNVNVILNDGFDYVIEKVLNKINITNIDQINISNLNYTVDSKILFANVKGEVFATDGWLRSLSTIRRTGDATFKKFNKTITIEAHVGLKNLEIGYNNYTAKIVGIPLEGSIRTKVKRNSIALRVKVDYKNPNCTVDVEVDFEKFDRIDVDATGLKGFNWLLNTIVKALIKRFDEKIKNKIEKKLLGLFTEPIQGLDICSFFDNKNSTKNQ